MITLAGVFASGVLLAIQQVMKTVASKVIILGSVFALVYWLMPFMITLLPDFMDGSQITDIFNQMPDSFYWIFNLFALDIGFSLVMLALISRFLIRRLPIIG